MNNQYDAEASDPHNIAMTYLRMEKDVKELIVDTVLKELKENPYGPLAMYFKSLIQMDAKNIIRNALPEVRVAFRGESTY